MYRKLMGAVLIAVFSVSCEYGREAEEKLNKINTKAGELDALVNEELEKVKSLDSLLPETNKKLRKADSIIDGASKKLDSLSRKIEAIENILN